MPKVILASSSPRRRELLLKLTDFIVENPVADEISEGEPEFVAATNAKRKGRSVNTECDVVIACDTVVALDGKIFGKPHTKENAVGMLRVLRGKTHEVISGVYVKIDGEEIVFTEKSYVDIKDMTDAEIEKYVSEYLPLDKAGAYGIQDGEVAEKFEGDYDNIVGLPLYRIRKIFVEKGYAKE